MAKLNINITDVRDLITQSKNLTEAQRKEAQIARLYISQCKMPIYSSGAVGDFVMMGNVAFKSKTMVEPAFITGITHAGANVGLSEEDVLDTYTSDSVAMALCNHIQKMTMVNIEKMSAEEISKFCDRIERNLEAFGVHAREARVNLGVVVAAEQQTMRDVAKLREVAKNKAEENEKE